MYNKVLKKYYLYKLFSLALPQKKGINKSCYYFCKYLIKTTPYGDLNRFLREVHRFANIALNATNKKVLFICSNKIFVFYNFKRHNKPPRLVFLYWKTFFLFNFKLVKGNSSFVIWYNLSYSNKILALLKDQKVLSLGFINFHNQPNSTDYTLLLEARFFSSIFLFHFILKKLTLYATN